MAFRLVEVAVDAKADAIKFQTFRAESLATYNAPKAKYQLRDNAQESQFDMLRRLELSAESHVALMEYCKRKGILFLSTPFDEQSADFLDQLGVVAFKIPSGELTNLPFLAHVSRKGKPMIVSTGMSYLNEVDAGVRTIYEAGNRQLVLLHCVSTYPAAPGDVNLRAMETLREAFGVPVGFSDHTLGIHIAITASALGASVIEKHFTLDQNLPGPDHKASVEPAELAEMVQGIRVLEAAMGDGKKEPAPSEMDTAVAARRSLVIVRDLKAGSRLTEGDIALLRPGNGLSPLMKSFVVGKRILRDLEAGTVLQAEMLG